MLERAAAAHFTGDVAGSIPGRVGLSLSLSLLCVRVCVCACVCEEGCLGEHGVELAWWSWLVSFRVSGFGSRLAWCAVGWFHGCLHALLLAWLLLLLLRA